MIWRWRGDQTVQSFGPYIFSQGDTAALANGLVEALPGKTGPGPRPKASSAATPASTCPPAPFELLGHLTIHYPDGPSYERPHYYREIREDPGMQVWTHPRLEEFLDREYQRLALPRIISANFPAGEARPDNLVLGSRITREIGYVSPAPPVGTVKDAGVCLANHIEALTRDGLANILFVLDLGPNWSAYLVPDLLDHGFAPRMVLPYGGESDVCDVPV